MKSLLIVLAFVLAAVTSFAQTTTSNKLVWDQPNVTSVTEAQALTYRYYPDGAATGIQLTAVVCTGTTTVTCSAAFPAFTPGPHSLTLTAANIAGESPKSAALNFTFVVVPSAPTNPRIQ